jgi:hypothetical protein
MQRCFFLAVLLSVGPSAGASGTTCLPLPAANALPAYVCPHGAEEPCFDGRLNDAVWEQAPVLWLQRCPEGGPPRQPTSVRMYWNEEYLFVGARMGERDLRDSFGERDDPVYMEQAFEVFLAGGWEAESLLPPLDTYLEVDVSPAGTIFDAEIYNPHPSLSPSLRQKYMRWEVAVSPPELMAATRLRGTVNQAGDVDRYWTAELRIPWSAVPGPGRVEAGSLWRLNLNRISGQRGAPVREFQTWSELSEVCFHLPAYFGVMVLGQ